MKTNLLKRVMLLVLPFLLPILLLSCSREGDGDVPTPSYRVGGTISGLNGTVVLHLNGGNALSLNSNGNFTFSAIVKRNTSYNVTVSSQPIGQTCTVTNGSGTINYFEVRNVQVACTNNPYTIGGTVSGLLDSTLVLQNNGGDDLSVTANNPFTFSATLTQGTSYSVTVSSQPSGQTCTVTNGSGIINAANVTDIEVECTHQILIGNFMDGPVEGLQYNTATLSGYTDSNGAFEYLSGETVSFYIGDVFLGQAIGASEITPFDLAGITPPITSLAIVRTMNEIERSYSATPFEIAANIAVFLQTLDEDGVYNNGIQISSQIHALASGVDIDFHQEMSDFPHDPEFRQLIVSGQNTGLWDGLRDVRRTGYALNTLYAGIGITPDIHINTIVEHDSGADGHVVRRDTYTYDADGNKTMEEIDSDADDIVDRRIVYTYDNNGYRTSLVLDNIPNSTEHYIYTFDAYGYITIIEYEDIGGVYLSESYTYDTNGNRTMIELDFIDFGTVDVRYIYTYDTNGYMKTEEFEDINGYDVDYCYTYFYDIDGFMTMKEFDEGSDGNVDEKITYTYDDNGNCTMEEHDWNGDGDYHVIYNYDENGNRTNKEFDWDRDGFVDSRVNYFYQTGGGFMYYED